MNHAYLNADLFPGLEFRLLSGWLEVSWPVDEDKCYTAETPRQVERQVITLPASVVHYIVHD